MQSAASGCPSVASRNAFENLVALGARPLARLRAVVLTRLYDRVGARQPPGLLEVALFGQDVELDLHDPLERRVIAQERSLEAGRRPLEEPAHVAWMQGQQAVELGEGPIVFAHVHRERRRAVDRLGIVGCQACGPIVEGPRLVELAHELGHARSCGQRSHRCGRSVGRSPCRGQRLGVAAGLERRLGVVQIARRRGRRGPLLSRRAERGAERQSDRRRERSHGLSRHRTLNGFGP